MCLDGSFRSPCHCWISGRGLIFVFVVSPTPDSQDTARRCLRECLQQYASGSATTTSAAPVHHRWTLKFCSPHSALHPLCIRFLHGEPLRSIPELERAIAPIKFVILIEVSAERNHQIAGHGIALRHHHTEPFFSMVLRLPFIQRHLELDDSFITTLAEACSNVRDPEQLALRLQLLAHPQVVAALGRGVDKRSLSRIVRPIVYRCDPESQYARLNDVARAIATCNNAHAAPRIKEPCVTEDAAEAHLLHAVATRHLHDLSGDHGLQPSQRNGACHQ